MNPAMSASSPGESFIPGTTSVVTSTHTPAATSARKAVSTGSSRAFITRLYVSSRNALRSTLIASRCGAIISIASGVMYPFETNTLPMPLAWASFAVSHAISKNTVGSVYV